MQTLAKYKKICYHKQADFDNDKKRPHGQAVKTLPSHGRICGSIPHGATKKIQHHLVWCCIFLYAPKRNDAATCLPSFVFASANFAVVLRFTKVKSFRKSMQTETATSAWGYTLLRCAETTRQLVAVVRICVSKFCRSSPFYEGQKFPKEHANGNGNFRMGLHTSSVRGNDAATCCRRSYLRKQILAVGSHRPHFCFPVGYIWETAISAWGYTFSLSGNDAATCCRRSSICASKFLP